MLARSKLQYDKNVTIYDDLVEKSEKQSAENSKLITEKDDLTKKLNAVDEPHEPSVFY